MKWPFKRNKSILPSEVEDYYKAEKRERKGMAWALALGTLVITVVLALGVFYGARWAYRKISGTDERPAPAITSNEEPAGLPGSVSEEAATGPMLQGSQPAPNPPATPPAPSTPLPDTGPGETMAVFVAVTILGTLGYRKYILSKLNTA